MTSIQAVRLRVTDVMTHSLASLGFTLASRDIFARDRNELVRDLVFAQFARAERGGVIECTFLVSVACLPAVKVMRDAGDTLITPTTGLFGRNIGYLLPKKVQRVWRIGGGDDGAMLHDMEVSLSAVEGFFKSFSGHDDLLRGCQQYGMAYPNLVTVPVLLILAGRRAEALRAIGSALESLAGKRDEASVTTAGRLETLRTNADKYVPAGPGAPRTR